MVVQRGGHEESSPEFVEHDLLLGRVQRRVRNSVPSGVDVLFRPVLRYESGEVREHRRTRDRREQLKCFCMFPSSQTPANALGAAVSFVVVRCGRHDRWRRFLQHDEARAKVDVIRGFANDEDRHRFDSGGFSEASIMA